MTRLLLVVTAAIFAIRAWAATHVGFGDSEALYASWAAHPQPAYLDHPGLVGAIARVIGEGGIPTPTRAHIFTSFLAAGVPWLVVLAARLGGAAPRPAAVAGLVVSVVPEIAVGLFALTPDLVLAPLWLGAIVLAIRGLRGHDLAFVAAGLCAGIATSAKVSGMLLMIALAAVYWRHARRNAWAWGGLVAGLVVLEPIVAYEAKLGFPMLRHRFVETQHGAGLALSNLGVLVGGQLLYLSPIFAFLAVVVGIDLFRHRNDDDVSRLLFRVFAIPLLPLLLLSVWSPVAEPHWVAPALLALPIHAARRARPWKLVRSGLVTSALLAGAAYLWVLVPSLSSVLPASTDPKLDIANELYGWPRAIEAVHEQMKGAATPFDPEGREVVVVGPHWTVCAQLSAALPGIRVGCATPIPDDFDRWVPRETWRKADNVLFVTDNRFPGDGADQLLAMSKSSQSRVRVLRGGRTSRIFELFLYDRRSSASR